jgi:predicted AlkP superfamily phosphohydrolase/phosphomutase
MIMRRILALLLTLLSVLAAPASADAPKVLVLGFDGMDPRLTRQYLDQGLMPNVARILDGGGQFVPLATAIPPQSPVAWSTFITGMDPGGHGIFDFIHRDPVGMTPFLSTSRAEGPADFWKIGSWRLPRGTGEVSNLRDGVAFWQLLDGVDVDATVFKVPANFPPVPTEARTLSGMGTPDIQGTYGQYTYVTDDPLASRDLSGGVLRAVYLRDDRCETVIAGPANVFREDAPLSEVPLVITVDRPGRTALVEVAGERMVLREGEWSEWLTLEFELVPLLKSVRGVARVFVMETDPFLRLYVTPVQIDPAAPEMPISTPGDYSAELARAIGPYYTQGLPCDTKALEEDVFTDTDYLSQSDLVFAERKRQFGYELTRFAQQDEGFLFFYFNYPDQDCHMWWRGIDPRSPLHAACAEEHHGRIPEIYQSLDVIIGGVLDTLGDDTLIMIMSDHGFAPYNRSFHVNAWLLEHGYLALREGVQPGRVSYLQGVDWTRTRAYAVGINGLYLNLKGREAEGIVEPGAEAEALLDEIVAGLEAVVDPGLQADAIKYAYRATDIYHGDHAVHGPDIVLGYHRGWRGSNESALGEVPAEIFVDNEQKWSGDHCQAADEVPGILLSTRPVTVPDPGLADFAPTILRLYGVTPPAHMTGRDLFGASTPGS